MLSFFLIFLFAPLVFSQRAVKIVLLKDKSQDYAEEWIKGAIDGNFEIVSTVLDGEPEDYNKVCDSLANGSVAIIDITWSGNEEAQKIVNDMNVPYFKLDISMSSFLILLDAFLDFRNSTDVSLIFDDPGKVDEALYFWIDTTRLRMVISENLDKTNAKRLKQIRPIPNNFAIVATTENINKIFLTARNEGLVFLPERWNLVFLDFNFNKFDRNLLNTDPINLLRLDNDLCCAFLHQEAGCVCPEHFNLQQEFTLTAVAMIEDVLNSVVQENLELTGNLKCNETAFNMGVFKRFREILDQKIDEHSLIGMDKDTIRLKFSGNIDIGSNQSVAKLTENRIVVSEGQSISPIKSYYRIGITHAIPWSYKEKDPVTGETYWTGYCADFATKLAQLMNFDFDFVEPKKGTFGRKRDGVWDGVVGDLATGETDLAVTALIMTADREEMVDFVAPYFEQTGISIVMRKPVRKTSLFKFMTVLKLEVWLSIVGALIVTGFMVWFLDKYSPYSARNNKKAYPYPCREFTLKESFWFALTSFTPQGGGEAPKALSGRTLVAAYWLFVVLMLATFTANLAAFLTVERMQAPVQSLEQLARQSRINYTVVDESDTHKYFINMKNAEDTLYRMWKELTLNASTDETKYRVWDYPIREQYGHILMAINDSNPVVNASEGFRLVNEHLDADFAFIHDSSEIKYEISRNCNFTEVGEVFGEKPYAIAVQQGSHLQDTISKMILILQKERFFEQLQGRYWNHSAKGSCPNTDDSEGITLESLGGVFIATLFGLALAMITLAGEVIYYKRKHKLEADNIKKILPADIHHPDKLKLETKFPLTFNSTFVPVKKPIDKDTEDLKISHISLYPRARNRITHN